MAGLWGDARGGAASATPALENKILSKAASERGQDYEGYKELSPQEVAGMSDEEKLQWARAMSGDFSMTMDDLHKYFPQFDTEELTYQRETAADAVAGIGTGARGGLLKMAMDTTSTKARSGFSATGNPMVDKQRENVYRDMDQQMDTSFQASEHDESKLWTGFQQDWAERAVAYEEAKDIKDARDDSGGGGCCFIVLEASEGTGLDKYVRQYRDMACTETNREGYYKLAQVIVPFMRKYKLAKWFFKYTFVAPAKSYAKWYYTGKGLGWIFNPLRKFWLNTFDYLGRKHKLKTDNE